MLLTFANRSLSNFTVKYKFLDNKLTLILITDAAHKIYGKTKITLANCQNTNIYTNYETLVEDFFNDSHEFLAVSTTRLEKTIDCYRGFVPSAEEVEVADNGSAITAEIDNLSQSLEAGRYEFKLIDSADSVFDGAFVNFQEIKVGKIGNTDLSGLIDTYAELDSADYESIDNQELTFNYLTELSISDETANTNIVMQIIRK
jgi:hypothetical protein